MKHWNLEVPNGIPFAYKKYFQYVSTAKHETRLADEENISVKDRQAKLCALIQAAPEEKIRRDLKENVPAFDKKGGALKNKTSWLNTSPWKSREYSPLTPHQPPLPSSSSQAKSKAPAAKLHFVSKSGKGGTKNRVLAKGTTRGGAEGQALQKQQRMSQLKLHTNVVSAQGRQPST